jgi:hypothetical protein
MLPAVRTGLTAAGLVLLAASILLPAAVGRAQPGAEIVHTCTATDRDFIKTAQSNIAALGLWGEEYVRGEATAREVIQEAEDAEKLVRRTGPRDPSLQKTQTLMRAMFTEYARAIRAKVRNKDAASHMYRAYGLANFARDVLVQAAPELRKHGCDVSALL